MIKSSKTSKMVRKSSKMGSERRDMYNILGFIVFVATVCVTATVTMRNQQLRSIHRRSVYQMGKFNNVNGE